MPKPLVLIIKYALSVSPNRMTPSQKMINDFTWIRKGLKMPQVFLCGSASKKIFEWISNLLWSKKKRPYYEENVNIRQ